MHALMQKQRRWDTETEKNLLVLCPHKRTIAFYLPVLNNVFMFATSDTPIARILDRARYAPSGDNEQPWQFEITSDTAATLHIRNRFHSVNDPDGIALRISVGGLLEILTIAAADAGFRAESLLLSTAAPGDRLTLTCTLTPQEPAAPHPLAKVIETRQTHRGWMKRRRLTDDEKSALERALAPHLSIEWIEGKARRQFLRTVWHIERLRLLSPEIIGDYQQVIDWQNPHSPDRLPSRALGLNPLSHALFKQMLPRRKLFAFMLRFGGLCQSSYLEVGVLPTLMCGALVAFRAHTMPQTDADYLEIGRAMQRFWLTATTRGLLHHPNFLPIAVSYSLKRTRPFSADAKAQAAAEALYQSLAQFFGGEAALGHLVWLGRIGAGSTGNARSTRFSLAALLPEKK